MSKDENKELVWEGPKKGGELLYQKTEIMTNGEALELPAEWRISQNGKKSLQAAMQMGQTKHGLYATIPMICRGEKCPYADTCPLLAMDMAPEKERCPIEISKILKKYKEYSGDLGIEEDSMVDMTLLKDLIDIDIQLDRAGNKLAIDADFIQEQVVGISEQTGEAITTPQIHKAVEYKDKLLKKRHDILQLLNSTRKDKAGDKLTIQLDPSTYASQLMAQAAQMRDIDEDNIVDADFEVTE